MINRPRWTASGFTLIELVIAIAILAIIVGIAIPAYTEQVVKTNRTEGKRALMETAQALERCYTRFSSYLASDGCTVTFNSGGTPTENGHYLVSTTTRTATTFTLQAVRNGSQATRDKRCGTFTLTHTGQKGIDQTGVSNPWPLARCWN